MSLFETVASFISNNFRACTGAVGSVSDQVKTRFVEKMLFEENFLQKFGFPFKIRDGSVENTKFNTDSDNNKEIIEIEKFETNVFFSALDGTEKRPLQEKNVDVKIKNLIINHGIIVFKQIKKYIKMKYYLKLKII